MARKAILPDNFDRTQTILRIRAFGKFFTTLEHIAAKAGARVIAVNPSYTSQYLCYRDEKVFINCDVREYWDEVEKINVDRDINAAINIKRVGLELFPTINRRSGKISKSLTKLLRSYIV